MTKFVHIVQVHPVELGLPNLHKVEFEKEFETREQADDYIKIYNANIAYMWKRKKIEFYNKQAVYYGCVNDETGELV